MSKLDIRQPFRNDVEECRIQPNGRTYTLSASVFSHVYPTSGLSWQARSLHTNKSDHYPTLTSFIALLCRVPPTPPPTSLEEPSSFFPSDLPPQLLFRSILYPICEKQPSQPSFPSQTLQTLRKDPGNVPIVVKSYTDQNKYESAIVLVLPKSAVQHSVTHRERMKQTSYLLISSISSTILLSSLATPPSRPVSPSSPRLRSAPEKTELKRLVMDGRRACGRSRGGGWLWCAIEMEDDREFISLASTGLEGSCPYAQAEE